MHRPARSDEVIVGTWESRHDIIVYREPEVGIAWYAEARGISYVGSGSTPDEAIRSLVSTMSKRGISGRGTRIDPKIAEEWLPDHEGWIPNRDPRSRDDG